MQFPKRLTMAQRRKLTMSVDGEVKEMLREIANYHSSSMTRVVETLVRQKHLQFRQLRKQSSDQN